jgi:signal transduction histidine kinase
VSPTARGMMRGMNLARLTFGLRASLSASMVGLALLVSLVGLIVHTALTMRATVNAAVDRAQAVAQQAALLAGRAASQPGGERPAAMVRRDRALASLFESALAGDPTLYDLGVFDPRGRAYAHSQAERLGQVQPPRPTLEALRWGGVPAQALRLLGPARTYDAVVALSAGGRPFGEVRVGVSTALLREQLLGSLRAGLWVIAVALVLAMIVALGFAQLLSRRVRDVVTGVQRLGEGEFGYRLEVEGGDELALLASSLNELGERLEASRARAAAGDLDQGELLMATDRVAAWAKVASGLAHEMADPLNAAALHLGHLKRKWSDQRPENARHLAVLEEELKRLDQVVKGFRRFAMLGEMRAEWFDLRGLLVEVAERTREAMAGHRLELVLDVEAVPERFWGDRALLRQALTNLIANAEQATPGGGHITLAAHRVEGGIEISVTDEGVGIPEELQARVFDLYFTTKDEGTGIGLAVVHQVVQLHGGRIRLRSAPGEGTQITLELPVRSLEAVHAA